MKHRYIPTGIKRELVRFGEDFDRKGYIFGIDGAPVFIHTHFTLYEYAIQCENSFMLFCLKSVIFSNPLCFVIFDTDVFKFMEFHLFLARKLSSFACAKLIR